MPHFDNLIEPKHFKQEFLKGDKGAVYYCESFEPNFTSYMGNFKGSQVAEDNKARIIDNGRVTCAGNTMPDPQTMRKLKICNCFRNLKGKVLAV